MFLRLTGPREEVFLKLLVIFIKVFFINFKRGKCELAAIDQCALEFVVTEIVKGESPLFKPFFHEIFDADEIA